MRPADQYSAVSEILQADVMRFMAIIAFCLIAILGLVRSVASAPPAPARETVERDLQVAVPAPPTARRDVQAAVPPPVPEAVRGEVAVARPVPTPEPAPARASSSAAASVEPPVSDLAAVPPPSAAAPPEPTATPAPAAEQGLTLRFASDQDFLRLVSRGRVQVYAFDGSQVLHLGEDFRFAAAPAPGQVHELLPDTIPALMRDALGAVADASGYQWGIAMPERMARQVREFVDQGVSGELIIDRYGEVRLHDGV